MNILEEYISKNPDSKVDLEYDERFLFVNQEILKGQEFFLKCFLIILNCFSGLLNYMFLFYLGKAYVLCRMENLISL